MKEIAGFGKKDFMSGGWDARQPDIWSRSHMLNSIIAPMTADRERIENGFEAYVEGAYKRNGTIFACIAARQMVFSEVTFKWRRWEGDTGRPSDLFGSRDLDLLNRPWPGGTTGELLIRMEQDASLAGNSWWTVADDSGNLGKAATGEGRRLVRLRPDWVELVIGQRGKSPSNSDPFAPDAQVLAIIYNPVTGPNYGQDTANLKKTVMLLPEEVVHYSPIPDPNARFRGMSWLTPVLKEIDADNAATKHKLQFFENAAVPNMVVKFDRETSEDAFDEFVGKFKEGHQGHWNAYKTLFLMGGADVTPLTHDFQQMEFSATQGKGESRIAAAAGVPSSWVGFSEGMQGSSLNAGNFGAARRRFADGTIRPLWRMVAASLEMLVTPPAGAHLWFDDRDIAFLREDAEQRAKITQTEANAIDSLIKGGFEPDAAVDAIRFQDMGRLKGKHTGLVSVQMQAPSEAEERDVRLDATAIHTLVSAGFTHESVVEAVWENDLELLVEDPDFMLQMGGMGPFGGAPKTPSKPGDKPPTPGAPTSETEFDKPDAPAGEE